MSNDNPPTPPPPEDNLDHEHPVHRCIVRGESSDKTPFQRVYVTYDGDEAARFNYEMDLAQRDRTLARGDIGRLVEEKFPNLVLILEQHGNDIMEDIPESLPIGEGYWDEHDHVQLLKRALMTTENEWRDSIRKAGNEMASNLPTLMAIGLKGDVGYWFAGACGLGIAGAIGYRGHRQNKRFERALKIFVEFANERTINPDRAREILDKRMRSSGLLFSGLPEQDLSQFSENHYIQVADKRGLWHNKNHLSRTIHRRALPDASAQMQVPAERANAFCSRALQAVRHGLKEQGQDLILNPFSVDTWKNVGRGGIDFFVLAYEFRNTVSRNRAYTEMVREHPEFGTITIEDHQHMRDAADHNILQEISVTKKDLKEQKTDGTIMATAFAFEAGFMTTHAYEAYEAGKETFHKYAGHEEGAGHATDGHHTWIDEPEAALGLSIYSMFMASGAWSYLGREISSIKHTLQSRRARILHDLYPKAMRQYKDHFDTESEVEAPSPSSE